MSTSKYGIRIQNDKLKIIFAVMFFLLSGIFSQYNYQVPRDRRYILETLYIFILPQIYTDRKDHLEVYLAHKNDRNGYFTRAGTVNMGKYNMDFILDEAYPAPKGEEPDIIDRSAGEGSPDWYQRIENRK